MKYKLIIVLLFLCVAVKAQKQPYIPYRTNGVTMPKDSSLAVGYMLIPTFTSASISGYADRWGSNFGINRTNSRLSLRGNGTFLEFPSYTEVQSMISSSVVVSSVFGRTGAVVAQTGDYSAFYPILSGSYANPSWITSLAWGKITGTPTTLSGYGITDAVPSSRTINGQALSSNVTLNTSNISEVTNLYATNSRSLLYVLTGYTAGTSTVLTAATTYLDAFRNLQAQITSFGTGASNLNLGSPSTTSYPITNSNGTGIVLPQATTSFAGLLNATDKTTLSNLSVNTSGGIGGSLQIINAATSAANNSVELRLAPSANFTTRYASIQGINDGGNNIALSFLTGSGASITEKLRITNTGAINITTTPTTSATTYDILTRNTTSGAIEKILSSSLGSGTVTSVTRGLGFASTGTSITTTGTLDIDTTVVRSALNSFTKAQSDTRFFKLNANNTSNGGNTFTSTNEFTGGLIVTQPATPRLTLNSSTTGFAVNLQASSPSTNYTQTLQNASGTIALTSDLTQIVEITGTSQAGNVNTIYIPHNSGLTTISLPALAAPGALFQIIGEGAGGWKISQGASQFIVGVGVSTTVGTGGSIESTNANCTIALRYTNTNKWTIVSSQGTLVYN